MVTKCKSSVLASAAYLMLRFSVLRCINEFVSRWVMIKKVLFVFLILSVQNVYADKAGFERCVKSMSEKYPNSDIKKIRNMCGGGR